MNFLKVAVIGKMRSGKDTFARYFIQRGFKEYKFGTGIAEVIQAFFPEEWAKGKPRHLYQGIGQYFRTFDEDVWVKYVARQIGESGHVIITDVRQENEVKWLMENGFKIVKVVAPEETRIQRMIEAGDVIPTNAEALFTMLNHETEQFAEISPCDYCVTNAGSIADLEAQAESIYQDMMWEALLKDGGLYFES